MASIHDYKGLPGEPNPEEYPRDDDYRQDHSKWHEAKAQGKTGAPSIPKTIVTHMKKEARLDDSERKEMYEAGRKAGKEEAKAPKAAPGAKPMGPQFRSKKPMTARVFLTGMRRGVRHKAYRPPSAAVAKTVRQHPRRSR